MAYEQRWHEDARSGLRRFLDFYPEEEWGEIIDAVEESIGWLAANPEAGQLLSEPFGRPVYRFSAKTETFGAKYAQVAYSVDDDEQALRILGFGIIPY